ncbi:hypothetical protein [Haematobacter massiliensis]|uniref:hypothetical protein n=1 Tax=Haematobacter massiliensis TaxID=195105 RepID=UPI0023F3C3D9|nr:hypothetical protein [Haematobacter massiliensis]
MRVIDPPAGLPVTVEAFCEQVHADPEHDAGAVEALLLAAVEVVETAAGVPMLARTVEFETPNGRWSRWWFPVRPVIALMGAPVGVLESGWDEPRLLRGDEVGGVTIRARVGHEAGGEVPQALRQAVILLAREWWEAALTPDGAKAAELSFGVYRLIRQGRYRRPQVVEAIA